MQRLRGANHDLSLVNGQEREDLVTATSDDGQRRLMLTSWDVLLDRLAEGAREAEDDQACFEIADLRGLAYDAIIDDDPEKDANLKQLIADAVRQLKESGWANTDGLAASNIENVRYAKFFHLGGRITGLRIDQRAKKQMRQSLWLWFWDSPDSRSSVSLDEVRDKLGASAEPGLEWLPKDVCIPIDLPAGAGREARLDALVAELERIAKILDPYVPTYHRDPPTD